MKYLGDGVLVAHLVLVPDQAGRLRRARPRHREVPAARGRRCNIMMMMMMVMVMMMMMI